MSSCRTPASWCLNGCSSSAHSCQPRPIPDISPPLSPLGTILLQYAFTLPDSATADKQLRLRSLVQTTYENALLAIPGVAQVTIYGGDLPQTQVQLNLASLQQRDLAFSDVVQATRDSLFNGRGGVQVAGGQERLILPPTVSTASADLERHRCVQPLVRSTR